MHFAVISLLLLMGSGTMLILVIKYHFNACSGADSTFGTRITLPRDCLVEPSQGGVHGAQLVQPLRSYYNSLQGKLRVGKCIRCQLNFLIAAPIR